MKAVSFAFCLLVLSTDAVINQSSQEAQRREAPPAQSYGAPAQSYGAPAQQYGAPSSALRQNRIQNMQRLIAAMKNAGGYASQGRVINQPRPIPISQPPQQNSYGPPKSSYGPPPSSSSGSLASFMSNHNPDVRCDGWVPIQGPSVGAADFHSSGGSASSSAHVDSSYGPPRHGSGNSGLNTQIIVVSDDSYGAPVGGHSSVGSSGVTASYSVSSGVSDSYGPPPPVHQPSNSYGPPNHGSSGGGHNSGHSHSSSGASAFILSKPTDSYGPPPPVQQPSNSYGPPKHSSGGSAGHENYGPPPSNSYGPPKHSSGGSAGHETYGPPAPVYIPSHESQSGHSSQGSSSGHQSVSSFDNSYAAAPVGHATYGPPSNSYGAPASGHAHSEESHHSSQGHASGTQSIQSIGQDLQLPEVDSGDLFNNAIGLVTSSLGVSAGQNEVVQSHAIHESHTSEVSNNFNGGDSYTSPPLDSYAPGKYAPSFLKPRPPSPPAQSYLPQRPPPRPQYIAPVPLKHSRPQPLQTQQYRPQFNSHAQSIAQGYSSGQSHTQSLHAPGPIRQQPRYPLPHRAPVPQGLFQSIGQHVQALDEGHRAQGIGNTYIPPPTHDVPIPPMRLSVPNHGPSQPFLSQHQLSGSGSSASSNSAYSYQNQELRNVHIIHDCGKGPQLSPSYGTPLGQPLTNYQAVESSQQSHGLSSNYEIPQVSLDVPQQNSIDFNSNANSYGPPASGPASLDVVGLESQQRTNSVVSAEQQNIVDSGTEITNQALPGLSDGLSGSGLDFLSAQQSQSIELPANGGQVGNFELQFTQSHSDQNSNRIDAPSHQQILADGLLQSILTAIEQKPVQAVPQVTEDLETDHSEVQVFLKSPEGQEVLADKPATSDEEEEN